MISYQIRRVTVRHLPDQVAFVEIDCRQQPVRRLENRETLYKGASLGGASRSARRRGCGCLGCPSASARLRVIGSAAVTWTFAYSKRLSCSPRNVPDIPCESLIIWRARK